MLPPARLALIVFLPLFCTSCKTIYTDVYSHKRNYFVPDKPKKETSALDKKALEDVANAPLTPAVPAAGTAPTIPGLEPAPALPDMGGAAPAPAPAPAVPGL